MKKSLLSIITCSLILTISLPITSKAGSWQMVENDWKYQNEDGSYLTNSWLEDNGDSYYFNSNGFMLKNTLSPDGFPLTRNGKRLVDQELLPGTFPGSKENFILLYEDYDDYWNNFDRPFNISFDEVFSTILKVYNSGDYETARSAISYIDSFDFTPYISSENIAIRKAATISEIFRIEQVYYLSEIVKASEQQDRCNQSDNPLEHIGLRI